VSVFSTPVRADRPLRAEAVDGNLLYADGQVAAWFILGDAPWLFRSVAEREATLAMAAAGFAALAGCDFHLRVTSVPFNADGWAAAFDSPDYTPDPLPDFEGSGRTWVDRVHADKAYLAGFSRRIVMLGVTVGRAKVGRDLPADVAEALASIETAVVEMAPQTRPATAGELIWLIQRSVSLGTPAPLTKSWATGMDQADVAAMKAEVSWSGVPTGRTVEVRSTNLGVERRGHVAVLTMGRMERRRFPEDGRAPWLQFAERLPFDVEVSVQGRVLSGADSTPRAEAWLARLQGIRKHYADHDEELPPAIERSHAQALAIHDRVSSGSKVQACSVEAVVRFAIPAETAADAVSRGVALVKRYGDDQFMWPVHTRGQFDAFREFTPGEAWDDSGFLRGLPVPLFAASLPHAAEQVGTPVGPVLGHTIGGSTSRPCVVLHDGHYPMEVLNQSGFVAVVANLGAGKSVFMGSTAYERVTRGITTALFDASPQGPLARLCDLPELAEFSRHIPLSGANAGLLNPYRLVPVPAREVYRNEAEWREACDSADGDRRELTLDVLLGLLPPATRVRDGVEDALRLAVTRAPCSTSASPWAVLAELARIEEAGQFRVMGLAEVIHGMATSSASFAFPRAGAGPVEDGRRAVLTVITTGNLQPPPPGSLPSTWSASERTAMVKLNLAAHLTTMFAYGGDPSARKSIVIDECRFLKGWESGRTLVRKLGFDFRKYDGEPLVGGQDPAHLTDLDVASFLGGVFLGRQTDTATASAALRLAGIAEGAGFEAEVLALRTGQFIYRDAFGRVNRVQVMVRDRRLLAALDTTPGAQREQVTL
jgi:hypothetical protein